MADGQQVADLGAPPDQNGDVATTPLNPNPVQQGNMLNGGQQGIAGHQNFFGSLVSTLLRGAVQGGVQGLAQAQNTAGQRAMSAGIRAPQILQRQQAEQSEQQDAATERKMRLALTQVQYLQATHALTQADQSTQKEAHDVARGWFDHLYQNGDAEIVGGTSEDRGALLDQYKRAHSQYPNDLVMIAPTGFSTAEHPTYGVFHVKNNSIEDATDFKMTGDPENGLPPMTTTVNKGTNANDGTSQVVSDMRRGIIVSERSRLAPQDGLPELQMTPDQLRGSLKQFGKPIPDNLDDLWSIANGHQALSTLPAKSVRNGKEFIIGKDFAEKYIRNFNPRFDPDKMAAATETRKTIDKLEGNFAEEDGKFAEQAIQTSKDIIDNGAKNPGSVPPELIQRAQTLITKAKPFAAQYQAHIRAANAKKDEGRDFNQEKILFNQRQEDGIDQKGQKLTLDEADGSTPVDEWGNPIPLKKATFWKPGAMADQTVKTATVLLSKLDAIENQIKQHPNYVGPIGGSIGELKQHFGLNDKEAQMLYDDITTAQSGFTKVHTSRFSKEILQKSTIMLNPKMNVQAALGAIQSMRNTAQLYQKDDKLMSKDEYTMHQQEIKQAQHEKMATYLKAAGYQGGPLTDDIKAKAVALAKQDGQEF